MRSIGSSLFKPQTVLLALEPRRGTRRNSAAGRARARLPCEHQRNGSPKGGRRRSVSCFFGLWPLPGGDDARMASCGVIRCSGEPWVGRKDEEGEI